MAPFNPKRVIAYPFHRQPFEGFVTLVTFGWAEALEILSPEGFVQTLPYQELKALCFVAESGPALLFGEGTAFERRPKLAGLWTRFRLQDGDQLDGVLPHNMTEWPEAGYLLVPPRAGALRQKVFLPRSAVKSTELLGVIGRAPAVVKELPRAARKGTLLDENQLSMFD